MALQASIQSSLSPEQAHFFKPRTVEEMTAHITTPMPVLGVRAPDGSLVSMVFMAYPEDREEFQLRLDGYPITTPATTAIIQSLGVHPDWTGHKLSMLMLDAAKGLAAQNGFVSLIAKVAQNNLASRKSFLSSAFSQTAQGRDPQQGYAVDYLSAPTMAKRYG